VHLLIIAPEQIPVPPLKGGSVEICIYVAAIAKRRKWAVGKAKQARDDAVKQFSWQPTAQSLADFYRLKQEERHEKNAKETD